MDLLQMVGASIFALCMWLRFEPGLQEWIEKLELSQFYIGIYVLLIAAAVMMIISFIGCVAALQENTVTILIVSKRHYLVSTRVIIVNFYGIKVDEDEFRNNSFFDLYGSMYKIFFVVVFCFY